MPMNVTEALNQYRIARINMDYAKGQLELCEKDLVEAMAAVHQKSATLRTGETQIKVTYVQNSTVKVNEEGLRKALGARVFNKYTVRKIDKNKLETGIATGEVDGVVVSQYCEIKSSKPYIRYTEGAASEPSDQPA